jgi:hypothetical protein
MKKSQVCDSITFSIPNKILHFVISFSHHLPIISATSNIILLILFNFRHGWLHRALHLEQQSALIDELLTLSSYHSLDFKRHFPFLYRLSS